MYVLCLDYRGSCGKQCELPIPRSVAPLSGTMEKTGKTRMIQFEYCYNLLLRVSVQASEICCAQAQAPGGVLGGGGRFTTKHNHHPKPTKHTTTSRAHLCSERYQSESCQLHYFFQIRRSDCPASDCPHFPELSK